MVDSVEGTVPELIPAPSCEGSYRPFRRELPDKTILLRFGLVTWYNFCPTLRAATNFSAKCLGGVQ
jgi:hypothetical protein